MPVPSPSAAAVVLAGGSGTRVGLDHGRNKVYIPLEGRPLLAWSLRTLDAHAAVSTVVVVIRAGDEEDARAAIEAAGLTGRAVVVAGGSSRSQSEIAGIEAVREAVTAGAVDVVLVHDGARPFLSPGLVDRLVDAARRSGAAIPGLPLDADTVEVAADGTVDLAAADDLRRVQTPQAFDGHQLLDAVERARADRIEAADTAELVVRAGGPAAEVVPGDPDNLKVTTPADVQRAERHVALIARRLSPGDR